MRLYLRAVYGPTMSWSVIAAAIAGFADAAENTVEAGFEVTLLPDEEEIPAPADN